jgi:hypothetical protein
MTAPAARRPTQDMPLLVFTIAVLLLMLVFPAPRGWLLDHGRNGILWILDSLGAHVGPLSWGDPS